MATPKLDAFQVIADPSRRQILYLLSQDQLTIRAIANQFAMSRPAISKHIKILDEAGFIAVQVRGRERYCLLKQEGFNEVQQWLAYFDQFWRTKLTNLEALLNQKHP